MITAAEDCSSGLPNPSTGCPACGPLAIFDDGKIGLDRCAIGFFPLRELQAAPELRGIFVDRETRLHRGDLEQHAAGLAEIDRREIAAVANIGHADADRSQ